MNRTVDYKDLLLLSELRKKYIDYHKFFDDNGIFYDKIQQLKQGKYFTNIPKYTAIIIKQYTEINDSYEKIKQEFLSCYSGEY